MNREKINLIFIFLCLNFLAQVHAQEFSKFIIEQPNSPFTGTSFIATHELQDSSGFVIIGDRFTNHRDGFVIKTNSALSEVWTTILKFDSASPPFDNVNYFDIGQLLNGNIYVHGVAADLNSAYHCIFILDSAGNVIQNAAIQNIVGGTSIAYLNKIRIASDSTLILPFSEYNKAGFLIIDQNLNVLNVVFTTAGTYVMGRDAIMLHDSTILFNSNSGLIKTDLNGNLIWVKNYPGFTNIFCLYESPSGSIFIGGNNIGTSSAGALMKIDSAGIPQFMNYYTMAPSAPISTIWEIYPIGNEIQCYSDSVMFRVDTNGIVQGWGKSLNALNYKIMKPGLDNRFILTGSVFQDSTLQYQYTVMKFSDTTQNGCLRPRIINQTAGNSSSTPGNVVLATYFFPTVNSGFTWNPAFLDFDAVNGCPQSPNGISDADEDSEFICYPNPSNLNLTIVLPEAFHGSCQLRLLNIAGQEIMNVSVFLKTTEISTAFVCAGLYQLIITDADGHWVSEKIAITH